jgi:hypothetical protein
MTIAVQKIARGNCGRILLRASLIKASAVILYALSRDANGGRVTSRAVDYFQAADILCGLGGYPA